MFSRVRKVISEYQNVGHEAQKGNIFHVQTEESIELLALLGGAPPKTVPEVVLGGAPRVVPPTGRSMVYDWAKFS